MNNNISAYKAGEDEDIIYYGKAALRKGFYFVDGDEPFYRFIGKNSVYSVLELLHPEDVASFVEAAKKLDEGEQRLLIRMRCYNDRYRCLYITLYKTERVQDNVNVIDMIFSDFMLLKERYDVYVTLISKYRQFMSLVPQLFFEYTFETDVMEAYQYVNQKSIPLFKRKLADVQADIMDNPQYSEEEKLHYKSCCDIMRKGAERFEFTLLSKMFSANHTSNGRYQLKGSVFYRHGKKVMAIGTISMLGEAKEKKSYYLSENAIDHGTGLLNKRAIQEYAIEQVQYCAQVGRSMYLAVMDVDNFKTVNDTFGHMFGDEVLSKVAEIIRGVLNGRGFCGRFGGDEFMIVMDGISTENELRLVLKTIAKNIMFAFDQREGINICISTSIGISRYPDNGKDFEELFQIADKALYIAKLKGKNRYIIYEEEKHANFTDEENMTMRNTGVKSMVSDEQKAKVIADLVAKLYTQGHLALEEAMCTMRDYFDMDGVTIYIGEDLHREKTLGIYVNPIQNLFCMHDSAYMGMFDSQGIYQENTIHKLMQLSPEAYESYVQQENGKFIQCAAFRDQKPMAVVAFDFFNRSPKYGISDFGMITIAGKLMAEVACGLID